MIRVYLQRDISMCNLNLSMFRVTSCILIGIVCSLTLSVQSRQPEALRLRSQAMVKQTIPKSLIDFIGEDNDEAIARLLLQGANPNARASDGQSALHRAMLRKPRITYLLLAAGANPNVKDFYGRTPLFYIFEATMHPTGGALPTWDRVDQIAHYLLLAGASISIPDDEGRHIVDLPTTLERRLIVTKFLKDSHVKDLRRSNQSDRN